MPKKKQKDEETSNKLDKAFMDLLKTKVGLNEKQASEIKLANNYVSINDAISTGQGILDSLICPVFYKKHGRGGVPRGFLCEFFGPNSGGKTSLAMKMAANVTKSSGYVYWTDAEHSFMETWAESHGIDLSHVIMGKDADENGNPFTGEQHLEEMEKYIGSGAFALAVVDSLEALVPKNILEASLEENARIGEKARLMSRSLPRIVMAAKKGNCTVVFINQIRQNISAGNYGPSETTPGGEALRFYSSLRLRISQVGGKDKRGIMKDGEEIGIRSNVLIKKSRFGPPYRETVVPIYYGGEKPHPLDILINDSMGCGLIKTRTAKGPDGKPVQNFYVKGPDGKPIEEMDDLVKVAGMEGLKSKLSIPRLKKLVELMTGMGHIVDPEASQWLNERSDDDPLEEVQTDESDVPSEDTVE